MIQLVNVQPKATKNMRGSRSDYSASAQWGIEVNAEIEVHNHIRIHGVENSSGKMVPYDRTFRMGDTVHHSSYNVVYFGVIMGITEKSVIIRQGRSEKDTRMDLFMFAVKNATFNEEQSRKRNSEWMD